MKKYLLLLSASGLLVLGLTGFIKNLKSDSILPKETYSYSSPSGLSLSHQVSSSMDEKNELKKADAAQRAQLLHDISQLPLVFEKNMGQWRSEVLYRASTPSAQVGFRKKGLTFFSCKEVEEEHDDDDQHDGDGENNEDDENEGDDLYETMVWNLNFKDMNSPAELIAEGEMPGVTSYLKGTDSTKWIRNTPQSRLLNYQEIYDHIDLHYYGLENQKLEYDFIVKPGGAIASIQMELDGAGNLTINNNGELIIKTPWGNVAEAKPYSYQVINGVKKTVDIRYHILNNSTFGFKAYGDYDKNHNLVIDPKQLVWTTFTRGSAATYYVQDIGIDGNKNSYITGWAIENFSITAGVAQAAYGGAEDSYVCKFNRWGTALVYCTYVGGSARERGFAIAVNAAGNAYISGRTDSGDYPTTGGSAFPTARGGTDTFVAALSVAGNSFVYSTYLGGSSSDKGGRDLFVNAASELYITGMGKGSSFPTTAGVVRTAAMTDGTLDAFVTKLTAAGAISFSTLLGGSSDDEGNGIHVSPTGEIYVTGSTKGNFPITGGFDNTIGGASDAFVTKLNATATAIIYSSYLGGGGTDIGYSIWVRNNEAYVTGTAEAGFPTTAGAYRTASAGLLDVFVTKVNAAGSAMVYSTFLGGAGDENSFEDDAERGCKIVVNNGGEAYVTGITASNNFPVINGYDMNYNGGDDGFISLLSASGSTLLCSSYIGGTSNDYKKFSIAIDPLTSMTSQDTLYTSITAHSASVFDGGIFPVLQTQGNVYNRLHFNGGDDQPAVMKMYGCAVPLPVELLLFKGGSKGDHNLLEWSTASETNNDYFSLEKSMDGNNFTSIAIIDGAGTSKHTLYYSYTDLKTTEDITYYRLKQTDFDGTTSYSTIVAINAPQAGKALELFISCPVTDQLIYSVCCLQKGHAQVEIIDLNGKIILKTNVQANVGFNKFVMDAKNLAEGLYILKFSGTDGSVSGKFVK